MNIDQLIIGIKKALEIWTLQNLCNGAIIMGFLVLALVAGRGYLEVLKTRLSLRVAIEAWETVVDMGVDVLLLILVLIGLFVTNLDVLADIKVAVPWVPLAFLLMGAALIFRAFYGGHAPGSSSWWTALGLITAACLLNWFGFTFVMEAPGHEYLKLPFADTLISLRDMRSNANPSLSMTTFLWMTPLYALEFAWGLIAALRHTVAVVNRSGYAKEGSENSTHVSS
jgi:hypothetical protein